MMKKLLFSVLISCSFSGVFAQESWMTYPTSSDSDSLRIKANNKLDFSRNNGKVELKEDARLPKIGAFLVADKESIEGVKMDGFRVMIFFDQKKILAEQQKATFISIYPDHSTYVDYIAPNYRVRVGNFRYRLEAEGLKSRVLALFPTAIVVKDKIQLPSLERESEEN